MVVLLRSNPPVDDLMVAQYHMPRSVDTLVFHSYARIPAEMAPYRRRRLRQRAATAVLKLNWESLTHELDPQDRQSDDHLWAVRLHH